MRLLHVIERVGLAGYADVAVKACAAMVSAERDGEHTIVVSGSRGDQARACRLGLEAELICAGVPGWPFAPPGVRAMEADRGPCDLMLIWSAGRGWQYRSAAPRANVHVGWEKAHPHASFCTSDLDPACVPILRMPLTDVGATRSRVRTDLDIADDETVVVLVGHADDDRAGSLFVFALGLVQCAIGEIVGLIPASPGRGCRAARLQRPSRLPSRLVSSNEPEDVLIAAADAVVVCPRAWMRGQAIGSGSSREVNQFVLAGAAAWDRPFVLPDSDAARRIAAHTGATVEFVLNSTTSEIARGLIQVFEGESAPIPADDAAITQSARRFSQAILQSAIAR